jgi:uncharacterized iron-regulated membrane protein
MISWRKWHRKLAPILVLPLAISAVTGILFRVGQSWVGLPPTTLRTLLSVHQGAYLGDALKIVYVLLLGLGLVGMIVTGLTMFRRRSATTGRKPPTVQANWNPRFLHRRLTLILVLPLFISALTGILYRLGRDGLGLTFQQIGFLMQIHQGSYLGSTFQVIYVLLLGLGLLAILITGVDMIGLFRRSRRSERISK